ncbi:MAG: transposase [Phaeodactylibacter sp.]|nr:transposase [Phaeodactylibacter sp.]
MSKLKKRYSKAEQLEIVKLSLDEGTAVVDLAEQYGVHVNTIYKWRDKYYKEHGIIPTGQGIKQMTEEEREIAKLKKQLREAELERDILKKAIGIFSKKDGRSTDL